MPTGSVDISIIIVTFNSAATIGGCLSNLSGAVNSLLYEIIVVDNTSTDDTLKIIESKSRDANVIRNTRNEGFGAACNKGVTEAHGEFILLVNPDARLDEGSIPALVKAARQTPNCGFAVPRLRFPSGEFQASCRQLPTTANMIFSRGSALTRIFQSDKSRGSRYTLPDFEGTTVVPAVAATVALVKRETYTSHQGFDPRFFMYMEDTDLCARLGQSGFVHLFVPTAGAVHEWGKGSSAGSVVRLARHHLSVWKYFLKHFPNGFSVIVLPFLLVANMLVALLLILLRGRGSR